MRPPVASSGTQSIPPICDMYQRRHLGGGGGGGEGVRDIAQGVSTVAKKAISLGSALSWLV